MAPARDGTVWFTAQAAGELGRLDPRTGRSRRVTLGAGSAPHGVIVGPDDAAWVTDGGLERDPAGRREVSACAPLSPPSRPGGRKPEHRHLRPSAASVVHGPGRRLRPARFALEPDAHLRRATGTGPIRHRDHSRGAGLVRLSGREPHRAGDIGAARPGSPRRPPARAPAASGPTGAGGCGSANGTRGSSPYDPAANRWHEWRLPGDPRPTPSTSTRPIRSG